MPKYFLLIVLVLVCGRSSIAVVDDDDRSFLTAQQLAWLTEHQVLRIAHDPDFPPIEFVDDEGIYRGISADYYALIEDRLGIEFEVVKAESWEEVLRMAREREIDIVTLASRTADREAYLDFAKPFLSFPSVIIVRTDVPGKMSLEDLKGKRVGSPSEYAQFERLMRDHPEIETIGVPNPQTCLRQVSLGELDACILRLPVATHFISVEGIVNLRIAGEIDTQYALGAACRNDWPELTGIIDATLETISQKKREAIFKSWVRLEADVPFYATRRFWLTVAFSLAGVGAIFAVVLFWNWQLRNVVAARTAELAQHRDHLEEQVGERTKSLQDSEQRFRTLTATAPDAIVTANQEGIITLFNEGAEREFGYSSEQIIGQPLTMLMPPRFREAHSKGIERYLATRDPVVIGNPVELAGLRSDGTEFPLELSLSTWQDSDGSVAFSGILRNITDRKLAEFELKESQEQLLAAKNVAEQANQAKSSFLANMSHEIRTPMNGILGMTELLLNTELTPEQIDYQNTVLQSANALLQLLNDILDFSKIEAGKLDVEAIDFDLRETVGDTLLTISSRAWDKGIELAYHIPPDVPQWFVGDPTRLRQIVMNLAGNAIKFTDQGEVVVEVKVESRTGDKIQLHIAVRDTGIGIPSEKQSQIFESFSQADSATTRRFGGTGLGLTISRRLVELMNGRIWVESKVGQGSTFQFIVELGVSSVAPPRVEPGTLRDLTVLVVDDNATNRLVLREILASWSMNPTTVDSGAEALVSLERACLAGKAFQLAILDVMMPEMDGLELTERIRGHANKDVAATRLMIMSSAAQADDRERAGRLGVTRCLNKPVKQSVLLDAITSTLGTAQFEDVAEADESPIAGTSRVRVLLAEDGLVNQKLAICLLENRGHSVVVANNGREAVDALFQPGAKSFDVVLMDMQMPVLDGLAATREIRKVELNVGGHIPIVAMTANAMKGDREKCLESGMDDYLSKPIRKNFTQRWRNSTPTTQQRIG